MTVIPILVRISEQGAEAVRRRIRDLGGESRTAIGPVNLLKGALLALGAGISLGAAFNTIRSFSKELGVVQAVSGATDAKMKELRAEFERLGSTTAFSASQAAEGAAFLSRAGFSADQTLTSLKDTLNLAQAGALDLASAADISSNVLTGFNMNASEMGRIVDVIAYAANNSNTSVHQLGEGMKYVAPLAAGLGVSLEETAAAIGKLSDAGIQGSMAGTSLRGMLIELSEPSDKLQKSLARVGLSAADVNPQIHSLSTIMNTLKDAGFNVTDAIEGMETRSAVGFQALISNAAGLSELSKGLDGAAGAAERTAEVMQKNVSGAALSVMSALEGVILTVGRLGLEMVILVALQSLATVLRLIASALEFLIPFAINLGIAFAILNAGLVVSTAILWAKIVALEAIAVATWLWNAAILANPLVALGVAIVAIITLLIMFADKIEPVRLALLFIQAVGIELGNVIAEVWASYIKPVWDGFATAVQVVIEWLKNLLSWIGELVTWFARLTGSVSEFGASVNATFEKLNKGYIAARANASNLTTATNDNTRAQANLGTELDANNSSMQGLTASTNEFASAAQSAGVTGANAFDGIAASATKAATAISGAGAAAKVVSVPASRSSGGGGGGGFRNQFGSNTGGTAGRGGGISDMTRYMSGGGSSIYRAKDYGGFATGGGFTVGGASGTDRNLVMFRATRGEDVQIRTPAQQRAEGGRESGSGESRNVVIEKVEVNIMGVSDPNDFRRTERQMARQMAGALSKAVS